MIIGRDTIGTGGQDGIVLDLTMQGDGLYHCVYTVQAFVGSSRKEFSLQVDTGSSDIWLASTSCSSRPSCSTFRGPKYDPSGAEDTGDRFQMSYQRGSVNGPIVLDTLEIGGYSVRGQALAAANEIENEVLATGNGFTGLLGLAPQENSIIAQELSEEGKDDGSTFLAHLFEKSPDADAHSALTTPGPRQRFVSLLLERPYYPGPKSRLGIGAHPPLPSPYSTSQLVLSDLIPTKPGPLFWRVPLTRLTADVAGTARVVSLGSTEATGVSSIFPVVVFDSGGTSMLSTRTFANTFYGIWGIGPGKDDGQYYVPCTLSMNVTMTLGLGVSVDVPIHPLDMSAPIPTEPGSAMCLGALQASDSPISQGDLILGAPFLRNVYTVLSHETDPPKLGILPLTNHTAAVQEFITVRVNHQSLGSSPNGSGAGGSTYSPSGSNVTSDSKSTKIGLKVLGGVLGFLVIAGLILWLSVRSMRRKWNGQSEAAGQEKITMDPSDPSNFVSGREKRMKAGRSVFGMEVDEPFTMFGTNDRNTKDVDAESAMTDTLPRHKGVTEDGVLPTTPKGKMHIRPPGFESVDSIYSRGPLSPLLKDSRYPSVYSVSSMHSSIRASEIDITAMRPADLFDNPPPIRGDPRPGTGGTTSSHDSLYPPSADRSKLLKSASSS